jgi:peroxiredoxin
VKAGESAQLDFTLREGAVVRGVVRTQSGKPVAGALVDATRWRGAATIGLRAVTNTDGEFIIESAPPDPFELTVAAENMGRDTAMVTAAQDEPIVFTVPDPPVEIRSGGNLAILRVGDVAPPVSMTTLEGKPLRLSDFRGKTVVLDFWATWCVPCIADLPHLQAVHERFSKRDDFVMIAISLDLDEQTLRGFLEKHKLPWHHVFGEDGGAQTVADRFGVRAIPMIFIIEPEGEITAVGVRGEQIVEAIERVLEEDDAT